MKFSELSGKFIDFAKKHNRKLPVSALALFSALGIILSFTLSGARLLYRVKYSGKDIAFVENKADFESAKNTVVGLVKGNNVESNIGDVEYTPVVTLSRFASDENEVVNAILDNTDNIVHAYMFSVDGVEKFKAEQGIFEKCLDRLFEKYSVKGAKCSFSFEGNVSYRECFSLANELYTKAEVNYVLSGLEVKTVAQECTTYMVPYATVEVRNDNMFIGSREVVFQGKDGVGQSTVTTEYINGNPIGESTVTETILQDPVDEIVNIGTAIPSSNDSEIASKGYVFPLPKGKWRVSAYFGDGRGHKGIDLSAKTGTPIKAVAAGRVIRAEWYAGYGKCVDIDHGFGFVTRYAHCNSIDVVYGQNVEAGETIALVGSTGDSSGSHLHIEFIHKNKQINPAMYLGLN